MSEHVDEGERCIHCGTNIYNNGIYGPWHRWFAWRPVQTVDRGWRWLRFVQRRRFQLKPYLHGAEFWSWFQFAVAVPVVSTKGKLK